MIFRKKKTFYKFFPIKYFIIKIFQIFKHFEHKFSFSFCIFKHKKNTTFTIVNSLSTFVFLKVFSMKILTLFF